RCLICSSLVFSIKYLSILGFCIFEMINSIISGCESTNIIICAPRLEPPCSTRWVNLAMSFSQETDPEDFPLTPLANVFLGLKVDPFVPTPPPLDIISITCYDDYLFLPGSLLHTA